MAEKIKLDYGLAEEMIRTFQQGEEQLKQTRQEMLGVASTLESGALLGRGGEAFREAIRDKLCPSIDKLSAKFQEMSKDVRAAVNYMRQADAESKAKFR